MKYFSLKRDNLFLFRSNILNSISLSIIIVIASIASGAEQNLPASAEPGRIEKRFEQPLEPKSLPEIEIRTYKEPQPVYAEEVSFVLKSIRFEGMTAFKEEELSKIYNKLLSTNIRLSQLYKIADDITAFYRNKGYVFSRAVIPPQKIDTGIALIQVIEGYINEVIIEGDIQGRKELFDSWIAKIKASRPLNIKVLERYTLLADDLPGAIVKSVLKPSKDVKGAADLVLVIRHKALESSAGIDNRGTDSSGPYQATFSLGGNSFFNLYEKTNLFYAASTDFDELNYVGLSHVEILSSEGTKLSISANHSRTKPGDYLTPLEIRGRNTTFSSVVTHPFIRSRLSNLEASLGFVMRASRTETLGELQSIDRTRVIHAGITYDFSDWFRGITLANLEIHHGLNILNATETGSSNLTRADGHSDFTKITGEFSRTQNVYGKFDFLLAAKGQYAFDSLLASEEFSYGGTQFGLAYDSSEITGDHGVSYKAELQYTDSALLPVLKYIRYYQLYAFTDFGEIYSRSATKPDSESGASAGLGIRFNLYEYLSGYLEVDKPLTRKVELADEGDENDPRIFFSLAWRY